MSEEFSVGYDQGYQDGWNECVDAKREWVSLTDDEIRKLFNGYVAPENLLMFRAIEAALKEKNS